MEANKRLEFLSARSDSITPMSGHETWLPPWVFKHEDLMQAMENAPETRRRMLSQTPLTTSISLRDSSASFFTIPDYKESLLLNAYPQPSIGKTVTCHWENKDFSGLDLDVP